MRGSRRVARSLGSGASSRRPLLRLGIHRKGREKVKNEDGCQSVVMERRSQQRSLTVAFASEPPPCDDEKEHRLK